MDHLWENLKAFAWSSVWAANLAGASRLRSGSVRALQVAHMLAREYASGELPVRAASLVYTTLLSIVPALAVSFAVMKAFGVHEELRPTLMRFLEPLGYKGVEIGGQIIAFVEHLDLAALGSAGVVFLIVTIVSLLNKTERALNYTWRVSRRRRFFERFSGYLTVVMIGPVLVFTAMRIVASSMHSSLVQDAIAVEFLGFLMSIGTKALPYLLVIAAFTFIYVYMPNTKVRIRSAIVGACVAGILWASVGWLFASFVVTSAKYSLVYSSFAILVLFMMWLYLAWLIVLIGGAISFYHQHPEYLGLLTHELGVSNRVRERLGLAVCFLIAQHHRHALEPWSAVALARRLRMPLLALEDILQGLARRSILVATAGETPAYVPARSLSSISLRELLATVRSLHESVHLSPQRTVVEPVVESLLDAIEAGLAETLGAQTLEELVAANPPPGPASDGDDAPEPVSITSYKRDSAKR